MHSLCPVRLSHAGFPGTRGQGAVASDELAVVVTSVAATGCLWMGPLPIGSGSYSDWSRAVVTWPPLGHSASRSGHVPAVFGAAMGCGTSGRRACQ